MPSQALATGFGAAEGLERLLTRQRADEEMARRVQQEQMLAEHYRHMDDMSGRTQDRADRSADIANDAASTRADIMKQIGALLKAPPEEDRTQPLIAGSKVDTSSGEATVPQGAVNGGVDPSSGEASTGPRMVSGFQRLNTPEGRTMMQMAQLNPNETFGSIPQPAKPKGPEDFNEEESWLNGQAKQLGHADYRAWMDADPAAVQKAHKKWVDSGDNAPHPTPVQTIVGGVPGTQFVNGKAGDFYAAKPPSTVITRADNAHRVSSHIGDILAEANALDKVGLMGPIAGRWSEFGAGTWGSAADIGKLVGRPVTPQEEEMISEFKSDVGLLKSGMAMVHGGTRGGGSIEMNKRFDQYMNSNHMDVNHFRGATKSFQKWLNKYADLSPDYDDNKSPDAAASDPGADAYAAYLRRHGGGTANPPK